MNAQEFMDVINKNFNDESVKAKLLIEFVKSQKPKPKPKKKVSKLKGCGLIPMLIDRNINIDDLLRRTGANRAYLNRLDDGTTKMTKKFASEVDSMMRKIQGMFYRDFMFENS